MEDIYWVDERFKLVAGGQTGADRAALDWAIAEGVRHGGWCPRGRRTEDGPLPEIYKLQETPASGYLQRTEWNVRDSDATLIFTLSDKLDGGSKRTADFADRLGKPWLHVRPGVHPKFVARFLAQRQVLTLNVAGKRESGAPGVASLVRQVLAQALRVRRDDTAPAEASHG
jgi:hypothetical protein